MTRTVGVLLLLFSFLSPKAGATSESLDLILPIVATGFLGNPGAPDIRWETSFVFLNLSATTFTGDLEIFQNDGTLVEEGGFSVSYEIPANGLRDRSIFTQSIIPPPPFPTIDGWARLRLPAGAPVQAQTEVRINTDFLATVTTLAHVPAVRPARRFRTVLIDRLIGATGQHRQTAYAIVNPSETDDAKVKLSTSGLPLGGEPTCNAMLTIPPRNRVSRLVEDLFPTCQELELLRIATLRPVAAVTITSDIPIAVGALDVLLPEGRISALPVQPVE